MSQMAPFGAFPAVVQRGDGRSRRLTFAALDSIPGLAHAFSLRNSSHEAVLRSIMHGKAPLHLLKQVHGATVRVAGGDGLTVSPDGPSPPGDALVTDRAGVAIGVRVADCVPILICDPIRRAIASVHAGWRGTTAGVLSATIETMAQRFRSAPSDLRLVIGPAIGPCCFAVGAEVIDALLQHDPGASNCVRLEGRRHLVDLPEANRRQAVSAGVPSGQIVASNMCTACEPELFWSYRREGNGAGRMLALIGWME